VFKSNLGRLLVRIAKILAVLYIGLLLLVFLIQRSFIYHPDNASFTSLEKIAASQGFQAWRNAAGEFLGWKQISKATGEHGRVLIVHGNAGSAIDRLDIANGLLSVGPMDVYILEYPGYGARPGSPSQNNLFQAAAEAMNLLKQQGPVYLMGESLGTGVAAYVAGTFPELIRGVLLIAPYNTLTDVAQYHMPIFPVKWMLRDRFASATYLKNYHGPIGILVGGQDVIVPIQFGRKLYEGYQGPKRIWESPQAGHGDLLNRPESWWQELVAFWKQNSAQPLLSPAQ
jgi:pimeloyl-ACP methyl ester carboxylesterase